MALERRSKQDFETESLYCSICNNSFDNETRLPKCLPCLHCFCRSCLEQVISEIQSDNQRNCPICRKIYYVPEKGVDGLQTSYIVENLPEYKILHDENASTADQKQKSCNSCSSGNDASGYCDDCSYFVCKKCINMHETMKVLNSHKIIPVKEFESSTRKRRKGKCTIHEKDVSAFCASCKKPICDTCGITTHSDHKKNELKTVVADSVRTLKILTNEARRKIEPLETLLGTIDGRINDINTTCTTKEADIDNIFANMHSLINERCKQSKQELRQRCQEQVQILKEQKDEVEVLREELERESKLAEQTYEYADPVNLFIQCEQIKDSLEDLIASNLPGANKEPKASNNILFDEDHHTAMNWLKTGGVACIAGMHFRNTSAALTGIVEDDIKPVVYTEYLNNLVIKAVNCNGKYQECGGDAVSADLSLPDKTSESCEIVDNKNGTYTISYITMTEGIHQLNVSIFGQPIKGSPFNFTAIASDVSKATYAPVHVDIQPAITGIEHKIKLNISSNDGHDNSENEPEVGVQRVEAVIVTQTGESVACNVKCQEDSNYHILFKPIIEGHLSMNVSVNGIPSIDNPYKIPVLSVCPKATSMNVGNPVSNQEWCTKITPRNNRYQICDIPDDAVDFQVINSETKSKLKLNRSRNDAGEMFFTTIPKSRNYQVAAKLCGHLINTRTIEVKESLVISLSETLESRPYQITGGLNNDIYVSDTQNNKVYSYNKNGLCSSTTRCETKNISHIAIDAQGRILLLFPELQRVHVIDRQGNELLNWSFGQQHIHPAGIISTSDGRIFITESKGPSILIFKSDGKIISRFRLPNDSIAEGMNNVCADNTNSLILAHFKEPKVYIFNSLNGQVKRKFLSGATDSQIAIATVEHDILVAQFGVVRVIRMLDEKPQFLCEVHTATHIFTSITITNDGCFFGLDVSKKQMVKYGYQ